MPIFQPYAPPSATQKLFARTLALLGVAACCALGVWEALRCAALPENSLSGNSYIAALISAIAVALAGILLAVYWRTRTLGLVLILFGPLSYGVFLGSMAVLTKMDRVAWKHSDAVQAAAAAQQASVVIYFRKGTTSQQMEDFHTTVIQQPGQPMHPEPEDPWFLIGYLHLAPSQANGYDGAAITFRRTASSTDTAPFLARIRADRRVEKLYLNVAPSAIPPDAPSQ